MSDVLVGARPDCSLNLSRVSLVACVPVGMQMFVYNEVMSSVTRYRSGGATPVSLIIFRKCVVFFTCDLLCVDGGLRKWSPKAEIFLWGNHWLIQWVSPGMM